MDIVKTLRKQKGYTQQQVADMLGINRITYVLSEQGKRQWKEDEILQLTEILNHPIHLPEITEPIKANTNLDVSKFQHLVLYLLKKIGINPNVGKTVLYKLLYFCDFDHYEKYGTSITGIDYLRLPRGPAPYGFDQLIMTMKQQDLILVADQHYMGYYQKKYFPNTIISDDIFDTRTKEIVDEVIARIGEKNATEVSDYSHGDAPRLQTKDMEIIPYELTAVRQYPYSILAREKRKHQTMMDVQSSGIFTDLDQESDAYEKYRFV